MAEQDHRDQQERSAAPLNTISIRIQYNRSYRLKYAI